MFMGICLFTAFLRSHHNISIRLRSGLYLDNYNTLTLLIQAFCCRLGIIVMLHDPDWAKL